METGRELFTKFLRGESLSRLPFVPLVRGLAAKVGGIPAQTWNSDPTLWANSLMKAVELFNFDGVVAGLDFSLMPEACGCQVTWQNDRPIISAPQGGLCKAPEETGRMKHALEATKRVFQVARQQRACVAALTGPITLASQLFGRDAGPHSIGDVKELVVRMAEAFCRTGPDALIFLEGRPLALAELGPAHRRIYATLKNIASYYNIATGLYLQGYRPETVEQFASLKMDLYILGPSLNQDNASLAQLWTLGADALGVGLGVPVHDPEEARKTIGEAVRLYRCEGRRGVFFTSCGPLTRDVNLKMLRQLINAISQVIL